MDKLNQVRVGLQEFAAKFAPKQVLEGSVTSVDSANYLCDVEIETDVTYFDCRLRAVVSDNHSLDILPEVGSKVVMAKISDDDYFVLACDKITEYRVTVGSVVYKINADGHEISKGEETLKNIMNDLVDQVIKIGAYKDVPGLTAIKTRINSLLK